MILIHLFCFFCKQFVIAHVIVVAVVGFLFCFCLFLLEPFFSTLPDIRSNHQAAQHMSTHAQMEGFYQALSMWWGRNPSQIGTFQAAVERVIKKCPADADFTSLILCEGCGTVYTAADIAHLPTEMIKHDGLDVPIPVCKFIALPATSVSAAQIKTESQLQKSLEAVCRQRLFTASIIKSATIKPDAVRPPAFERLIGDVRFRIKPIRTCLYKPLQCFFQDLASTHTEAEMVALANGWRPGADAEAPAAAAAAAESGESASRRYTSLYDGEIWKKFQAAVADEPGVLHFGLGLYCDGIAPFHVIALLLH